MTACQGPLRRCVVLFARSAKDEESVKSIPRSRRLFELSRRRIARAVASLPDVDLILSSGDSASRCGDNKAIPQRGNGFDERFRNAMLDVAGLGYQQVVAIPIDVLELSVRHLDSAFVALRESPFVLGPSPDGGVYLIGFRSNEMPRFERIAWRTGRVFDELVEVLRNAVVIEPLADVDSLADLRRLSLRPKLDLELRQLLQSLLDPRSFGRNREEQRYLRLALPLLPARAPPAL